MISVKMNTKQYDIKSKKVNRVFKREWTKLLFRYGDLIVKRASLVHLYQNRTGLLSKSNKYKVTVKAKRLTIRNNTKYAKYVRNWERGKKGSDWINNAIAYYRKRFIKDLKDIGKITRRI